MVRRLGERDGPAMILIPLIALVLVCAILVVLVTE